VISPLLLYAVLAAQDQVVPPSSTREVHWQQLESSVEGESVVYRVLGLEVTEKGRALRANSLRLRLDRLLYLAATGDEHAAAQAAARGKAPAPIPPGTLTGQLEIQLLHDLGLPEDSSLIQGLTLEGEVQLEGEGFRLRCARIHRDAQGTQVEDLDLRLASGLGLEGWPLHIQAQGLREDPGGEITISNAALTTCDADPPHYALHLKRVRGLPEGAGIWRWKPSGAWLQIAGHSLLPLPATSFGGQGGEGQLLTLHGLRMRSNSRLGQALELEFQGESPFAQGRGRLDWRLRPTLSSRRGLPLRTDFQLRTERYRGSWQLFGLQDEASDVHPYARSVARDSATRWRLRLDNRMELGGAWRLDADLALTSDALVDAEFFDRDWRQRKDRMSELYLRRAGTRSFFDAQAEARTDDVGFAPFAGYGSAGSAAPRTLDTLPAVRYESYLRTLFTVPAGFLGNGDGGLPLDMTWGAEAERRRAHDLDLAVPVGVAPFSRSPAVERGRLRLWGEFSTPLRRRFFFVRPGVRLQALAYDERVGGASGSGGASRFLSEGFVELGTFLVKDWEHGWQHRVLPELRFRKRGSGGDPVSRIPVLDALDSQSSGEVVEFSLRQFFIAPGTSTPWADIDLLVPYYPDPSQPLVDPLFPSVRTGRTTSRWGPAEFRLTWTPGVYGRTLKGIRFDTRARRDLGSGRLEELFTRLTIEPSPRLRYGASLDKVNGVFSTLQTFAEWRINDTWGLQLLQPFDFVGNVGDRSRLSLLRHGHDFVFEIGVARDQSTGQTGFFFNLTPRFLVDPAPLTERPRMDG